MPTPVLFSLQQVRALCGGEFPHVNGFSWDQVRGFHLEAGLMKPYVDHNKVLPDPHFKMIISPLTVQETDVYRRNTLSVWKEYLQKYRSVLKNDIVSSFFLRNADVGDKSIVTIGDLLQYTEEQMRRRRDCGPKRLAHIVGMLKSHGLSLRES